RFGQTDRDRLLAAFDLLAAPSAAQRALLALLHRAMNRTARAFRIFACHPKILSCRCAAASAAGRAMERNASFTKWFREISGPPSPATRSRPQGTALAFGRRRYSAR